MVHVLNVPVSTEKNFTSNCKPVKSTCNIDNSAGFLYL